MKVEVQIKVGDNESWKDGMPIGVRPLGRLWTPAEVKAFVDDDTPPPGFDTLPKARQNVIRRRLRQVKWLTNPSREVRDLIQRRPRLSPEDAQARIDEAKQLVQRVKDHGLDINYGFEELKAFGIVIAEVAWDEVDDILDEGTDMNVHPFAPRKRAGRRLHRVPYETLMSGTTVGHFRDKNHTLVVNRAATAIPFANLLEARQ